MRTLPALRHLVHTRIRFGLPFMSARTRCKLGRNRRLVLPVIFWPAPPFLLAIPRRAMVRPATGPLLQIAHTRDIVTSLFFGIASPLRGSQ